MRIEKFTSLKNIDRLSKIIFLNYKINQEYHFQ